MKVYNAQEGFLPLQDRKYIRPNIFELEDLRILLCKLLMPRNDTL